MSSRPRSRASAERASMEVMRMSRGQMRSIVKVMPVARSRGGGDKAAEGLNGSGRAFHGIGESGMEDVLG